MTLLEQVRSTISNYHMLGRGDRVAAGVSGGADSVCLLRVLGELRQEYGLTLSVIHVHHGIRGAEADRDARFTEELCRKLAIPCQVIYKDIPALAASERCSEEEMGRAVRYEALMEYAVAHDCNRIAVAHNRDDHAETVIGNLCRGSGIGGLTGIPPVRDRIIRPLLFCGRAQIEEYLAELGQDYCDDSTNAGDAYTRNRIRHQVLPLLETAVNKKSTEHIIETAEQLRQVEEYLTERTGEQLERILWSCPSEAELAGRAGAEPEASKGAEPSRGSGTAELSGTAGKPVFCEWQEEDFRACPPALAGRVVLALTEKLTGHRKDFTAKAVRSVLELFGKEVGREVSLPCGIRAVRTYTGVRVECRERAAETEPEKYGCSGHGETDIREYRVELSPGGSCQIEVAETGQIFLFERLDLSENGGIRSVSGREITFMDGKVVKIPESSCVKWFDYDKMLNTVVIRTRRPGDVICLHPDAGRKKLKSYLIDRKIPREERDDIWFLAEGSNVIWIPGERTGENYRIDESTAQILTVQQ